MRTAQNPSRGLFGATASAVGRGSGRTFNAVRDLPDGGTFVVRHPQMYLYIRDMLEAQNRSPDAIKLVSADTPERLRGLRRGEVAVDHDVWASAPGRVRAALTFVLEGLRP